MGRLTLDEVAKEDLLKVGDVIEFDHGVKPYISKRRGDIETVGKHGYWIHDYHGGGMGHGSIRCDFEDAVKIT